MIQNIICGPPESNKSLWSSCHSRRPSPPHPAVDTATGAPVCTAIRPERPDTLCSPISVFRPYRTDILYVTLTKPTLGHVTLAILHGT